VGADPVPRQREDVLDEGGRLDAQVREVVAQQPGAEVEEGELVGEQDLVQLGVDGEDLDTTLEPGSLLSFALDGAAVSLDASLELRGLPIRDQISGLETEESPRRPGGRAA